MRAVGNLLIAISVVGLLGLAAALMLPAAQSEPPARANALAADGASGAHATTLAPDGANGVHANALGGAAGSPIEDLGGLADAAPGGQPITRIEIPAIGLAADVVEANLVAVDGGQTWQVPAFKVGHAQGTAGAGEAGNAVLLGHVTSLRSGNVFQDLDRVHVGDTVHVFSESQQFAYEVVDTTAVSRTDNSVLQPTQVPSISLITCTGVWLPTIWDYTERLVVHAELAQ